jgi:DNA helicase HerA-like ATPase
MAAVLYEAIHKCKQNGGDYTFDDIINEIEDTTSGPAVKWRLNGLKRFNLFIPGAGVTLKELCQPGTVSIMNLEDYTETEARVVVGYFLKKIMEARENYKKQQRQRTGDAFKGESIDWPVQVFLEEAHIFAPAHEASVTKGILKSVATGGRKFGVGLCLITQRPSRIDPDILSQCNSSIILRITNSADQKSIRDTVEAASEDLIRDLPGLTPGQAVVCGPCVKTPVMVKIRQRLTRHGGESFNVSQVNIEAWEEAARRTAINRAPIAYDDEQPY